MSYELFAPLVHCWRESFLTKEAWKTVRQKIDLSHKTWKSSKEKNIWG